MTFREKYDSRICDLFALHQSVQNSGFTQEAYKPGLDGMRALDSATGSPSSAFPSIHVAGTNGKGSVCSMLAAALAAAGYRVGLYTSPHLLDFRERMKIVSCGPDGLPQWKMVSRVKVWNFLERYGEALDGRSFFEITTAMAFRWFADSRVDVAVIETGLGGRLDSTNILTPELSVVTGIGLDHCAILGDTRGKIAMEKAGIFKPAVPALVGSRDMETGPVFEKVASEVHCPLFFADSEPLPPFETDLAGPCSAENLRTVLTALDILGVGFDDGIRHALEHTATSTGFRGRWERVSGTPEVICDIGHNPPALELNFSKLSDMGKPLVIVYGIMSDKDLSGIAPSIPDGAHLILVSPDIARAMPVEELQWRLRSLRPDLPSTAAPDVASGVRMALEEAVASNSLVYIGGSTFVVAEAIPLFE